MTLTTGARLGPYEITATLGAGGMGEVYRARDTRLHRDVALKILPDVFAGDPERLARFQREAQVLASLNHPHIAGIYGLEESGGVRALVLELVDGETLADRIAQGPIPIEEALPIAKQIADALAAAHEHGIVHRDLKPSNIKITSDGTVKVLDFGLAKEIGPAKAGPYVQHAVHGGPGVVAGFSRPEVTESPTITSPAVVTGAGVILGTAAYMAPEQAKGRPADKRTDIWAFGCVLYEMLTGARPFKGDDVTDTLAAVLRGEPEWTALPAATPHSVRDLIDLCLKKDRKDRVPDMAVAVFEIDRMLRRAHIADAAPVHARWSWLRLAAALILAAVVSGAAAGGIVWLLSRPAPARIVQFDITPPAGTPFTIGPAGVNLALSPDGTRLAYHVRTRATVGLVLRRLDQREGEEISGTDDATNPVFSPDGGSLAFIKDRKLHRLALDAKSSMVLSDAFNVRGVSWATNDTIVFAQAGAGGGLFRVRAGGGKPERIAAPDAAKREQDYVWPDVLPGGETVLFTIWPGGSGLTQARIAARSLVSGEQKVLVEGASFPRYVASGHLLYVQGGTLMAAPFDRARLAVTGAGVPVQEGIAARGDGSANYVVSRDGTLAYVPGGTVNYVSRFVWKDRAGRPVGVAAGDNLPFPRYPRISPDGRRVAVTVGPSNEGSIWIYDLAGGGQPLKLTFRAHNTAPTWKPDGTRVVFESNRSDSRRNLYEIPADGSVLEPERIVASDNDKLPLAWSPDGQWFMYGEISPQTGNDLWIAPAAGEGKPRPWLQTPFAEAEASFSPDGRWVAYVSDQTGASEVWVRPFPGPGSPIRVSPAGGHDPVWSRSGTELFYQEVTKLMTAEIAARQPELRFHTPRMLFDGGFVPYELNVPRTYDVAPDGRFLMIEQSAGPATRGFTVVLNWFEELQRRVP